MEEHPEETKTEEKTKKKKTQRQVKRSAERANEWREGKRNHKRAEKKEEKKEEQQSPEEQAGPSTSASTTFVRRLWIRGSTLFRKKERREGEEEEEKALPSEAEVATADPAATYKALDESYKLSLIEEPGNLSIALRQITRHLHPKGETISYPTPDAHDQMQLKRANLPVDPEEVERLLMKAYARRELSLDKERLYRDHVRAHGRTIMDPKQPFPGCYIKTWQP
jgi:hypothetical protein